MVVDSLSISNDILMVIGLQLFKGLFGFWYLTIAQEDFSALTDAGIVKERIEELHKASLDAGGLLYGIESQVSHVLLTVRLILRLTDCCDSNAQVQSAIYDSLGYPTAVVVNPGHVDFIFKLDGEWYNVSSGSFS